MYFFRKEDLKNGYIKKMNEVDAFILKVDDKYNDEFVFIILRELN